MNERRRKTRQGPAPLGQPSDKASYGAKVISGSVGSVLTALVVTPLEVVKVRMQAQPPPISLPSNVPSNVTMCPRGCGTFVLNNGLTECVLPRNAVPYFDATTGRLKHKLPVENGTFSMIRRIFLQEGLQGLYAGLSPTLVMGVPNTALYFVTYEELASLLKNSTDNSLAPALAGATARFVASIATAPLELVRTRQAAKIGAAQPNFGMIGEIKELIRVGGGFLSLYRGVGPTLGRDCAFSSVYWLVLEKLRDTWRRYNGNNEISAWQQGWQALVNGSLSGMLAAACTTPLDVGMFSTFVDLAIFTPQTCN